MLCLLCPPWSWSPVWAQQHPNLGSCLPHGLQGVQAGGGGKLAFFQLSGEGSPLCQAGGDVTHPCQVCCRPENFSGPRDLVWAPWPPCPLLSSSSLPEAPPPGHQCARPEGALPDPAWPLLGAPGLSGHLPDHVRLGVPGHLNPSQPQTEATSPEPSALRGCQGPPAASAHLCACSGPRFLQLPHRPGPPAHGATQAAGRRGPLIKAALPGPEPRVPGGLCPSADWHKGAWDSKVRPQHRPCTSFRLSQCNKHRPAGAARSASPAPLGARRRGPGCPGATLAQGPAQGAAAGARSWGSWPAGAQDGGRAVPTGALQ